MKRTITSSAFVQLWLRQGYRTAMTGNDIGSLGDHLRLLREAAGLTQDELAERSGLSRDAISALERGRRKYPHPATLKMLAEALSLSEAEFLTLKEQARIRRAAADRSISGLPDPVELPNPLTSLIGRSEQIAGIRTLLENGVRLLNLTGPGGVGKTRLAIHVALELRERMPVAFVSLASVTDPVLVLPAIAQAFRLRDPGDGNTIEHLERALADQPVLIVLDNLEHLADAHLDISSLLMHCPQVSLLITSRSTLRIGAETAWPVPPLELATREPGSSEAVKLFVERAQAARPDFRLTDCNAETIAALCSRLDGLPLAIELAAARIKVLSPAAMLTRLDSRLDLLSGGPRDQAPRQQNIRATLDWSYELLGPEERATFEILGVFADSFALDEAEVVLATVNLELPRSYVLEHLTSLVDESLLSSDLGSDIPRFTLLHTVGDYARERLSDSGTDQAAISAHAACYLDLAERAYLAFRNRTDHEEWLDRIDRERSNIRQALTWFADIGDDVSLARLAGALYWYWDIRGPLSEGRAWLERVLALPGGGIPDDVRFQVLLAAGQLAHFQGDDDQAQVWAAELNAAIPETADPWMRATPLMLLGLIAEDRGDYTMAESHFVNAYGIFQKIGDEYNSALAMHHLGVTAWGVGDLDRAAAYCSYALKDQIHLRDTWHIANSYGYLGLIAISDSRPVDAAINLLECMEIRWRSDAREDIASSVVDFATLAAKTDRPDLAARWFGAAAAFRERIGRVVVNLPERALFEAAEQRARDRLSPEEYLRLAAVGAELSMPITLEEIREFADQVIRGTQFEM